jgi:phosphatidyl-myo-inositol dimannoside synthase
MTVSMTHDGSDAHRRPRLLIATPDFPPERGGIQVMTHRIALDMPAFQTRVVALDCAGAREFDGRHELPVRRVRAAARPGPARHAALNVATLREAARFRPQLALGAHIVTSPAFAVMRRTLGTRTVQYYHAEEITARPGLAAFAAREADASIAVSRYTAGLIADAGATPARMRLIPPGVSLPDECEPLRSERPVVLTVARLQERYKGHEMMVRALALVRAKVPDVLWVVIGEGSLRPALEQLTRAYGVESSALFLGEVSDAERNLWLRRARLLAMPSRLPAGGLAGEGFGIAYMEAASYGKPVVAGAVGGALDSVADGESGVLVDPTDQFAIAEAIATLLLEPELARRMGEAGARRAREFAWPKIAARVEAFLLETLSQHPNGAAPA